jgi:hypothetical protein
MSGLAAPSPARRHPGRVEGERPKLIEMGMSTALAPPQLVIVTLLLTAHLGCSSNGDNLATPSTSATSVAATPSPTPTHRDTRFVADVTGGAPDYPRRLLSFAAKAGIDWQSSLGKEAFLEAVTPDAAWVVDGGKVRRFDPGTGAEGAPLFQVARRLLQLRASQSGAHLAATTHPDEGCSDQCAGRAGGSLLVLNSQSGVIELDIDSDDPRIAEGLGSRGTPYWLSENLILLVLARFSSSLGSSYLIDMAAGTTVRLAQTPLLIDASSGLGVIFVTARGRVACYDWAALEVRDLRTWRLVTTIEGNGDGLYPLEFSPDGKELLVERHKWSQLPPPTCVSPPAQTTVNAIDLATGATSNVLDSDAKRSEWFGGAYLSWDCPPGLGIRKGNEEFQCNQPARLSWNGATIVNATRVNAIPVPR